MMAAWQKVLELFHSEPANAKKQLSLPEIVDQSRRDWLYAQSCYKTVSDPDLVDYFSFLIKAYERRYVYLLRKARDEGIRCPGIISGIQDETTVRKVF
jgi:hypothetical protein